MIHGPHNYYDEVRTYLSASPLLGLLLTLVAFQIAVWIHRRCHGNPLTNPIMLAVIVVVGLLKLTGVEYQKYLAGAQFVHFLLGPVTVALAIPLYAQIKPLTRLAGPLLTSLLVGSLIAVLGAWGLGRVAGASQGVLVAMAPKSATGPIAMAIAESLGGSPSLTMAVVLLTVKLRRPEEFEAAARPDTKAAVEAFAATSLAKKTAPEALAATKATTVGEL